MIISRKHRFVFVHNPKAAGSAIRKALEPYHDDDMKFWHQTHLSALDRVVDAAHLTLKDLKAINPELFYGNYKFFTVVRNPYERFLSSLAEFTRQHPEYKADSLDDWMDRYMDETNFRFNWKFVHFCPQHFFVLRTSQGIYLKHQNLGLVWEDLTKLLLGAEHAAIELPKVRVRPDAQTGFAETKVEHLSERALSKINRIYHTDFETLGFEKIGPTDTGQTHYERVNGIHSPFLPVPPIENCTEGERIAHRQKH